jgi:hypothetical protein
MSIFHIINFTGSWIFLNKKLILDYYFCLKSGLVFLQYDIEIGHIASPLQHTTHPKGAYAGLLGRGVKRANAPCDPK